MQTTPFTARTVPEHCRTTGGESGIRTGSAAKERGF